MDEERSYGWPGPVLMAGLAAGVLCAALSAWGIWKAFPPPRTVRLRAAAEAVREENTGGGSPGVLVEERYDREAVVALSVELEQMRRRLQSALAGRLAGAEGDYRGRAAQLGRKAVGRVSDLLLVNREQAVVILAALGWPGLSPDGAPPKELTPNDVLPRTAAGGQEWRDALRKVRESDSGQGARIALREMGLGEARTSAAIGQVCRRKIAEAWNRGRGAAVEALKRYGVLTRAQAEAVLAMAAATKLQAADPHAVPVLADLLEEKPALGLPLLRACVRRAGVLEQARSAAEKLMGPTAGEARAELKALGPFAIEALRARGGSAGRELLGTLQEQWPEGDTAVEMLGSDAARWRRWYREAESVL